MVKKPISWKTGAKLEEHSRRKHKVIREYFARYLTVRCQLPQQSRFRIAVVDGFAGGGRYKCGSPGSPVIFLEELRMATEAFNLKRQAEGTSPLEIECLLILNDFDEDTIELLKTNTAPVIAQIKQDTPKLHLRVEYFSKEFETAYPAIKKLLGLGKYQNVLFNLDQCGTSKVDVGTVSNIISSFASAEIFYTFGIETLLAFLQKSDLNALAKQLGPFGVTVAELSRLDGLMSKNAWLGQPSASCSTHFADALITSARFLFITRKDGGIGLFTSLALTVLGKSTTTFCTKTVARRHTLGALDFTCSRTIQAKQEACFMFSMSPDGLKRGNNCTMIFLV